MGLIRNDRRKSAVAAFVPLGHTLTMDFSFVVWSVLVLVAVGAIFLVRRNNSGDHQELGSVSPSWLAEHRSGRSDT
jgi:hypothetical protein